MPGRKSKRLPDRTRQATPAVPAAVPAGRIAAARLFMPQGYEPGYDYPLIVWLADDDGFDLGRVMTRTSLRNFVAVQPGRPEAGEDLEDAVWRAIDSIRDRASIHHRRIFLVGRRSAGTEAFRIACRHPDAFGGVVSIGGGFPLAESAFARLREVRRLPMLMCCRADAARTAGEQTDRTLRLFHAAGAMLAMRIYPGRRDLSRAVLADVNRWLMDEICGPKPSLHSECAR
jgi:phospholipase/carboxylesterase